MRSSSTDGDYTVNQPISLEDAAREREAPNQRGFLQRSQFSIDRTRELSKILLSAMLGLILWVLLGGLIIAHFGMISYLTVKMTEENTDVESSFDRASDSQTEKNSSNNDSKTSIEKFDKAVATINDTAKSLYTFLTPLATAVTGYYFTVKSIDSKKNVDSD